MANEDNLKVETKVENPKNESKKPNQNKNQKRKHAGGNGSVALSGAMQSAGAMRKKIRDIKRLLAKDKLPSDMRVANERALKTLELNLKDHSSVKRHQKIQKKYHMVRFFERKKAIRRYKKAKRELSESEKKFHDETLTEEEKSELRNILKKQRSILHHASVDFAYVLNYPTNIKYISLYTITPIDSKMNEKMKKGIIATNEQRDKYKKLYQSQVLSDSLEISIEDGLNGVSRKSLSLAKKKAAESQVESAAPATQKESESDSGSDSESSSSDSSSDSDSEEEQKIEEIDGDSKSKEEEEEDDFFE